MTAIERRPEEVARQNFDLVVVGGGIQGACLALEASRRRLRTLMLERDDFGGTTSWNSLRIIHGGLRHLQRFDLRQFFRSSIEQAWWIRTFPDLVRPLPCLMPLYNQGLRRTEVLGWALRARRVLRGWIGRLGSTDREDCALPPDEMLSAADTIALFPAVD